MGPAFEISRRYNGASDAGRVMGQISLDSSVELSDDAIFREMDGEAVILNLESGTYFGLDPVGTRIWQLVEKHGSLRVVFEQMRQEFDVESEVLERDLLDLVGRFAEKGLGTVTEA